MPTTVAKKNNLHGDKLMASEAAGAKPRPKKNRPVIITRQDHRIAVMLFFLAEMLQQQLRQHGPAWLSQSIATGTEFMSGMPQCHAHADADKCQSRVP